MIPKSFECMGFKIRVVVEDIRDDSSSGKFEFSKSKISIDEKASVQIKEQTFWHEWMHCALGTLDYKKLDNDEKFVDRMASLLYQLEKTRKD